MERKLESERGSLPSTTDSGNCSDPLGVDYQDKDSIDVFDQIGVKENDSDIDKGAEYYRYTQHAIQIVQENLKDGKRVITSPGWHAGKPGTCQVPINMDKEKSQPGYGWEGDSCGQKCGIFCGKHCGCPSVKTLRIGSIRVLARVIMAVLAWGFVWAVTFPPCAMEEGSSEENSTEDAGDCQIPGLPGTSLFGILMVFLFGMIAEALIVMIPMPKDLPPLPPLLGSLLVGILLRNVPGLDVAVVINPLTSSRLRNMALGIILGRAGLEVDKKQMYKLRWVVPRLAFLPCIIEACSYGVFAHYILGLPWEWSFLLGFVCGAVAPACVVPSMIKFQEEGYGVEHGVPSLLIAGASIDDIVAINVFNILLLIALDTGETGIGHSIGIAVLEIVGGLALGFIGGFFLQKVPDRRQHNIVRDRTFLLIIVSFFFIFATDGPIDLAGSGTLGTLICSFVAAIGWPHHQTEAVAHHFKAIWFYFQPLLFGLTGATVDLSLMDGETVGKALGCMTICLAIRLTVAGNAVSFLGWSHKEKLMTAISWIPKATVQAAIGGVALSKVELKCGEKLYWIPCDNYNDAECVDLDSCYCEGSVAEQCIAEHGYALIILQVSVLLIIITAPLGVFLIGVAGPRLLPKSEPQNSGEGDPENMGRNIANEHLHSELPNDVIEITGRTNLSYTHEGVENAANTRL